MIYFCNYMTCIGLLSGVVGLKSWTKNGGQKFANLSRNKVQISDKVDYGHFRF